MYRNCKSELRDKCLKKNLNPNKKNQHKTLLIPREKKIHNVTHYIFFINIVTLLIYFYYVISYLQVTIKYMVQTRPNSNKDDHRFYFFFNCNCFYLQLALAIKHKTDKLVKRCH